MVSNEKCVIVEEIVQCRGNLFKCLEKTFTLMNSLKELLTQQKVTVARLPQKNAITIPEIESLEGYTVPLIGHDYAAKTPVMWNTLYERMRVPLRNIMVVADPNNAEEILNALRQDPKYMGGGAGVGFKEAVLPFLDEVRPANLKAVNIVVNERGRLIGYNTDAEGLVRSLEEKYAALGKTIEGSMIVVLGAGGVAKEVVRHLVGKKARRIAIVNRTLDKAVALAHEFQQVAYGAPESMIRGIVLNSWDKPDAIVNVTDKGADGKLEAYSAFAHVTEHPGDNESLSRTIMRELRSYNPQVIIADIVLPKSGRSVTLRHADAADIKNTIDGKPMVVYQAVPAFDLVAKAHASKHQNLPSLEEILAVFKQATEI